MRPPRPSSVRIALASVLLSASVCSPPALAQVGLDAAPQACTTKTFRPPDMDPAAAAALAAVPADQRDLPPALQLLTEGQTNGADITCP